jgi:hypothetical protein
MGKSPPPLYSKEGLVPFFPAQAGQREGRRDFMNECRHYYALCDCYQLADEFGDDITFFDAWQGYYFLTGSPRSPDR